ncbi:hypothetical protein LG202_08750 [Methylobacillus methanolivorans]
MEFYSILKDPIYASFISLIVGAVLSWFLQVILNRRGLFTYYTTHNTVGMSANDTVFGEVLVTFNGNAVPNLYLSTLELTNRSAKDYENITVKIYTNTTKLFSEQTHIQNTPDIVQYTQEFKELLSLDKGEPPTDYQIQTYRSQRCYLIPVINRGQTIKFGYLNSTNNDHVGHPYIYMSINAKGVRLEYKEPSATILGIPTNHAGMMGCLSGLILLPFVTSIDSHFLIGLISFSYGLVAQLPGVALIKSWRKIRDFISG